MSASISDTTRRAHATIEAAWDVILTVARGMARQFPMPADFVPALERVRSETARMPPAKAIQRLGVVQAHFQRVGMAALARDGTVEHHAEALYQALLAAAPVPPPSRVTPTSDDGIPWDDFRALAELIARHADVPEGFLAAFDRFRATFPYLAPDEARQRLMTLGELAERAGTAGLESVLGGDAEAARTLAQDFYRALLVDTN